jgi:hypothetical protein
MEIAMTDRPSFLAVGVEGCGQRRVYGGPACFAGAGR